jgi:hypothetical protein
VFSYNIFANSGWCENEDEHTHDDIREYTNGYGMIRTNKYITYHKGNHAAFYADDGSRQERIITIHDSIGNLLFSKHYTWIGNMLIQTVDDGIIRNIIPGRTRCEFTVVEHSGDSIYFNLLDPKKKFDMLIRDDDTFRDFLNGHSIFLKSKNTRPTQLDIIRSKRTPLDAIIYQWFNFCHLGGENLGKEKMELIELSNDSISLNLTSEKERILHYKYYAIIIVCIAIACIVIIHKKHKRKKEAKNEFFCD